LRSASAVSKPFTRWTWIHGRARLEPFVRNVVQDLWSLRARGSTRVGSSANRSFRVTEY